MNLSGLKYEPAAVTAFLKAIIYACAVFGLNFTPEQILALGAVVESGSLLVIRSQTTTNAHLEDVDKAVKEAAEEMAKP